MIKAAQCVLGLSRLYLCNIKAAISHLHYYIACFELILELFLPYCMDRLFHSNSNTNPDNAFAEKLCTFTRPQFLNLSTSHYLVSSRQTLQLPTLITVCGMDERCRLLHYDSTSALSCPYVGTSLMSSYQYYINATRLYITVTSMYMHTDGLNQIRLFSLNSFYSKDKYN